jgi:hypothetical protein
MRRFFALVFLFLYLYNIVGYLAVFSVVQYRIRSEVKKMLKANLPDNQLQHLSFHTASLQRGTYTLQWVEDHEFRFRGQMFDIVSTIVIGDTTTFICLNDVQEERLNDQLAGHVQQQMEDTGASSKLDAFKEIFKDSISDKAVFMPPPLQVGQLANTPLLMCGSVEPDIAVPPPRTIQILA